MERVSIPAKVGYGFGAVGGQIFRDTPALILFHGRTVLHIASDGSATVVSQHGTMQDACGLVA